MGADGKWLHGSSPFGKIAVGRLKYPLQIGRLADQMNGDRRTTISSDGTGTVP